MSVQRPEVLAPGGDIASAVAAIAAGADALYIGLPRFNARSRATNITPETLPGLAALARSRGVKIFLTLNILFTQDELAPALEMVRTQALSYIDGIILQDLGMARLISRQFPGLELHASTQCTTHRLEQLRLLAELGFSRVNLSRELSISEIRQLTQQARELGMQTEVFVHGAFCVSMSGQCLLSSQIAGLSGNRGECVQPCRRRWMFQGMDSDSAQDQGEPRRQGQESADRAPGAPRSVNAAPRVSQEVPQPHHNQDPRPLLNLHDLDARNFVREMMDAGVGSLKIEGRMKGPDYVGTVVGEWRQMVDQGAPLEEGQSRVSQVFNRGFSQAYLLDRRGPDQFTYRQIDRSFTILGSISDFSPKKKQIRFEIAEDGVVISSLKGRELMILGPEGILRMRCTLVEAGLDPKGDAWITYAWFRTNGAERVSDGDLLVLEKPSGWETTPGIVFGADGEIPLPEIPVDLVFSLSNETGLTVQAGVSPRTWFGEAEPLVQCSQSTREGLETARSGGLELDLVVEKFGGLGEGLRPGLRTSGEWTPGLFLPPKQLKILRRKLADELLSALARTLGVDPDVQGLCREYWLPLQGHSGSPEGLSAAPVPPGLGRQGESKPSGYRSEPRRTVQVPPAGWVLCDDVPTAEMVISRGLAAVFDPVDEPGLSWLARQNPGQGLVWGYLDGVLLDGVGDDMRTRIPEGLPLVLGGSAGLSSELTAHRSWAAGYSWNTTNREALSLLEEKNVGAVWLSPELSNEQIQHLVQGYSGEIRRLAVPVFGPQRGMVLRNCMMPKAGECTTRRFTPACVASCAKQRILDQESGSVQTRWIKRPHHLPEVYNGHLLLNDEIPPGLTGIADLRNLGFFDAGKQTRADAGGSSSDNPSGTTSGQVFGQPGSPSRMSSLRPGQATLPTLVSLVLDYLASGFAQEFYQGLEAELRERGLQITRGSSRRGFRKG